MSEITFLTGTPAIFSVKYYGETLLKVAARKGIDLKFRRELVEVRPASNCPLVTGYGKLVLAGFDYDLKPQETFPFNQNKERLSMYLLKKYGLSLMYWHGMLKGRL